jgi:hypothetical protein
MRTPISRLTFLSTIIFALLLTFADARSVHAQTANWEYHPELGGYLDRNTGLVWGDHGFNVAHTLFMFKTVAPYLTNYRTLTGISQWRLPTVAESQTAVAHGINAVVPGGITGVPCWTSESKSKGWEKDAHYAVYLTSGVVTLYNNASNIDVIPVYRAFTP